MHGRVSKLHHSDPNGLFKGIPTEFEAVRYHSLIAQGDSLGSFQSTIILTCFNLDLPSTVDILARTDDGVVMAMKHVLRPCWGVQFHPEVS